MEITHGKKPFRPNVPFHLLLGDEITSGLSSSVVPEPERKHDKTPHEGSAPLGASQRRAVLQTTNPARLLPYAAPALRADKISTKSGSLSAWPSALRLKR